LLIWFVFFILIYFVECSVPDPSSGFSAGTLGTMLSALLIIYGINQVSEELLPLSKERHILVPINCGCVVSQIVNTKIVLTPIIEQKRLLQPQPDNIEVTFAEFGSAMFVRK
jgi:hypothetical protein